ncbi:DUF2491 family protein [Vreelandella populi]|uniref:DUF2491 family protein n=1 Tax=Vreelandella populi TaxID=2498858 RepID=A0A3S0WKE0_9GAMM|nr:DUF2491 family protein [Halomonas populi]RUR35328.1 DUF2491 family protein [Halomonas populi]RUR47519.1 DUF2491 family protein [Halomonas populi]
MLKTLKALFGTPNEATNAQAQSASAFSAGLPIGMSQEDFEGLRLDGRVKIQLSELSAYPDTLFGWDSDTFHHIAAVGHIDLDQGAHLVRFYLDNDTWLQANVENQRVVEYKLFDFYRVTHLSDGEFDALINPDDKKAGELGAQTITVEATDTSGRECQYQRVWGDEASLWSPPVLLEEQVMTTESVMTRSVTHHAMLYERSIEGSERMEYVLLNAENDGEGGFMLIQNLGVDVTSVDIDAI